MSEAGLTDLSRLLLTKRNESNAIVASRKRKLRELFAVATHVEGVSHDGITRPDAPPATQAENDFLLANDIVQGRKFDERTIPPRQAVSIEALKQSLSLLGYGPALQLSTTPSLPQGKEAHPTKQPPVTIPATKSEPSPTLTPTPIAPQPTVQAPQSVPTEVKPFSVSHVPIPKQVAVNQSAHMSKPIIQPPTQASVVPKPSHLITSNTESTKSQSQAPVAVAQKPPHQVTFTCDVKSPTLKEAQSDAKAKGERTNDGTAMKEKSGNPPSVKASVDVPRAPDALSSPGSTAPSATTPGGIHDRSTDTSPENEGPTYPEGEGKHTPADQPASEMTEHEETSKESAVADDAVAESPESAEAQLLQESSTAAVNSTATKGSAVTVSMSEKLVPEANKSPKSEQTKRVETSVAPESEVEASNPNTGQSEGSHDVARSVEIPDSREDTPEVMDVDVAESNVKGNRTVETAAEPTAGTDVKTQDSPTPQTVEVPVAEKESQTAEHVIRKDSSDAFRPKSVYEVVASPPRQSPIAVKPSPRPPPLPSTTATTDHIDNQLTPITSTPRSPTLRARPTSLGRRDKSRGQISAVLFGKQSRKTDGSAPVNGLNEAIHPSDDYYTPLFVQGFAGSSSWMQPMEKILFHANKTVATPDVNLCVQDHQACKVLRRVYHLQSNDKWSLRQPKRCPEPTRPPSHWDVLLQEAKWMRTDFREERKWKIAVARNLADACAEWCASSAEERRAMQVNASIPPKPVCQDDLDLSIVPEDLTEGQATPDLIRGDTESPQAFDELVEVIHETVAPSAIFSLQDDDVVFGLQRTAAADQLLDELPTYGTPLKIPNPDPLAPSYDPDAHWRRPALPLSRYVEGHMRLSTQGPPRKRSRYDYVNEDSADEDEPDYVSKSKSLKTDFPPESDDVALFNPEMKHIRDRLHAGHQFRPPTDHPMPTQSFYECRNPSMWIPTEDDELRALVRDYSYNWPLISSMLASKSIYSSGAERRTPWECFERWIQLEGLPSDMQKTQYFRAYTARIEAAQRVISQQNQIAAQQSTAAGAPGPPIRRRQSTPMRVERRRNQKHLTLMDAMRKVAKKREAAAQKQQQTASQNSANKKPDSVAQAQRAGPSKTPRDYSILRWERDQHLAEKMAIYANRQDATRRAAVMQARAQSQAQRSQAGGPVGPNGQAAVAAVHAANATANLRTNNVAQAAAMANQARPRMQMAPPGQTPNGMSGPGTPQLPSGLVPPMNGATPQAQMQNLQAQQRLQGPNAQQTNANLMMRAAQISEQQRAAVQMQQQQHHQGQHMMQQQQQQQLAHQQNGSANGTPRPLSQHNSPPMVNGGVNGVNVNGINQQNYLNNGAQAAIAQFSNTNGGHASPPANVHMAASSPRPQMQIPPAVANQISVLEAQFRAKNPNITPDQARQLATDHLLRAMAAQRHSAMSAAAGTAGQHSIANGMAASPHQYAALLRQQQQQQAAAQQQAAQQQQLQPAVTGNASQAASSPGQLSHTSHQRQSSESGTPSAVP